VSDCYSFGGDEGGGFLKGVGNNSLLVSNCTFINVSQRGSGNNAGGIIYYNIIYIYSYLFFILIDYCYMNIFFILLGGVFRLYGRPIEINDTKFRLCSAAGKKGGGVLYI
jgi:hypothetical protein